MPQTLHFDSRGRLTIPKDLRLALGETVVAIRTPRGVMLRPVPRHVHLPAEAGRASGEDAAEEEVGA